MIRTILSGVACVATVGAMAAVGTSTATASDGHREIQQTVRVVGTGHSVRLSRHWVYAGSIRFKVSTTNPSGPNGGGSSITLFKVKRGHTLRQFFAALQKEFSRNPKPAPKAPRPPRHSAPFRGLADVTDTSETVTQRLAATGTYYAMDLSAPPSSGPPTLTRLHVRPTRHRIEQDSDLASNVHVRTAHDRFHTRRVWPHRGTYRFTNRDDTIHFMGIIRVKRGTTDAEIQKALTSQSGPGPFLPGPSGGNDVVSPGRTLQVTYNLPKGTYVLICFVSDEETGMPHALMGMHKVVILK